MVREMRHSIFTMTHTFKSINDKMQRRHEERCGRKRKEVSGLSKPGSGRSRNE